MSLYKHFEMKLFSKVLKKVLSLLLFVSLIFFNGCQKKEFAINNIKEEDVFMQFEDEYYVYFYKDNCIYCDEVYDIVNDYLNNPKDIKLYVCKFLSDSIVNNSVEGGNGHGPNNKYFVNDQMYYTQLRIPGVPSLIKIKFTGYFKQSYYVTSGNVNIINYFNNL